MKPKNHSSGGSNFPAILEGTSSSGHPCSIISLIPSRTVSSFRGTISLGLVTLITLVSLSASDINAQSPASPRSGDIFLQFDKMDRGELVAEGFELGERTRLSIYAVGAAPNNADYLSAYAWILDARTREPVWVMDERDSDRYKRSSDLREVEDQITLPAGKYEAYYFVGQTYAWSGDFNIKDLDGLKEFFKSLGEALDGLGEEIDRELEDALDEEDRKNDKDHERDRDRWRDQIERDVRRSIDRNRDRKWSDSRFGLSDRDLDELKFQISSNRPIDVTFDPKTVDEPRTVIDFSRVGDDERLRKGFTLTRETTMIVRACGEYSESGNIFVDQGWIASAETRERVWEMDKWSTRYAGGARKNRHANEEITLPAGNYLAYYMTDDSHSFEEWNAPPPFDPLHYGIVLLVSDVAEMANIKDYNYDPERSIVFAIDRVGDDRFESQGFSLKKPTKLHIFALGEYSGGFADYAYIEDLETMEVVWEMTEDNTTHAGGAAKNRMFDDIISLPAGDYMAHYSTDGSHSYRHWNSAKPFEPEKWGITVYGVGSDFKKSQVDLFSDLPSSSEVLADLTRLCDDEYVTEPLTITEPTSVRIMALGEGSGGKMYDYGWIEEAKTGKLVWQMRYRKTRHAGGASKNRMENVVIDLEPGEYDVVFVTDGSHSYCDFNASKPRNPQSWGIVVSKK